MTFPCAVYCRGSYPGQIDHPGWLSKVVHSDAEWNQAQAEGWLREMADPPTEYDTVAEPDGGIVLSEPRKRGRKARD